MLWSGRKYCSVLVPHGTRANSIGGQDGKCVARVVGGRKSSGATRVYPLRSFPAAHPHLVSFELPCMAPASSPSSHRLARRRRLSIFVAPRTFVVPWHRRLSLRRATGVALDFAREAPPSTPPLTLPDNLHQEQNESLLQRSVSDRIRKRALGFLLPQTESSSHDMRSYAFALPRLHQLVVRLTINHGTSRYPHLQTI